ncbi:MAG: hypothetical protein ABI390_06725 [Daejeonella sp.]
MFKTHAGSIIEKAVRTHNISISSLSRKMNVNRRTLYNWFNQETLPVKLIGKIGQTLGHDFSSDFSHSLSDPDLKIIGNITSSEEELNHAAVGGSQFWMMKYIDLLEKYNALLVKNN